MAIADYADSKQKESELAAIILDIGEILLTAGAEVNRVEDTIQRIGHAYGFEKVAVFSITTFMVMTVHTEDSHIITQTRRIRGGASVDLERVARANALSREICAAPLPPDELKLRVYDIMYHTKHYSPKVKFAAYLVAASSFSVFFGGSALDAFSALLASIVLYFIVAIGTRIKIQPIILTMVCSFITTLVIFGLVSIGIGESFDKIVIGNIMLLIPGINLTTSIRDMITGDLVTGLMGLSEALLKALAIAVGCAAVVMMMGTGGMI